MTLALYHQVLNPLTNKEEAELEELEIKLIHHLVSKANKPILGICRGIQTINVAFNGTLYQDIPETKKYDNHLRKI
ncbi:MAG: gamma-glutamyl-gamma-aminobutyrate hydrolase family protein [Thomasclavelia ramosa]